jgi:hypothetical protein
MKDAKKKSSDTAVFNEMFLVKFENNTDFP